MKAYRIQRWLPPAIRVRKKKVLPAFTLVESMIATVILTASFFAGLLVFNQVLTGDRVTLRAEANSRLLEKWEEIRMERNRESGMWEINGLTIRKKVRPCLHTNTALQVTITASVKGEEIGRLEGLMVNEN